MPEQHEHQWGSTHVYEGEVSFCHNCEASYFEWSQAEIRRLRQRLCGPCQSGWGNTEDHSCELGDNGGHGPVMATYAGSDPT